MEIQVVLDVPIPYARSLLKGSLWYSMEMNLILLYGPPAAGKLTVANELAALTGYTLFDNHLATDYLYQLFPNKVPGNEAARAKLGRKVRLLIFETAAQNNLNLVVTFAPMAGGAHDFIRSIREIVERTGGNVCLVQLLPGNDALEERVSDESRRGGKVQTVERLRELMALYPVMFETFPDTEHLVIDNSTMQPDEAARLICERYNIDTVA